MAVSLKEAIEIITYVTFPLRPKQAVELVSGPGIGKSESITFALPKRLLTVYTKFTKVVVITIECSGIEPTDGHGFAIPTRISYPDGTQDMVMVYARPEWWPLQGLNTDEDTIYVIFLDEWSKTPLDVKKVFAPLINEGRVGQRHLPKNAFVVMASNRSSDRSGDFDELAHLQNRRMQLDISASFNDWEEWAVETGINPITIAFADKFPEVVFKPAVPDAQGAFCTPRSLCRANDALIQWAKAVHGVTNVEKLPLGPIEMRMLAGWVGEADASTFAAFARTADQLPSIQEIIKDPTKARLPAKERPDAALIVVSQLALTMKKETVKPFLQYTSRLPAEFQVAFVKKCYSRPTEVKTSLIMTKEYSEWAARNTTTVEAAVALRGGIS